MLFIGIDLGTSACKLLLVGEDGTIQNEVTKEYPLSFPHPGWAEQRPEEWWDAVVTGVPELLRGFDANDVAGIGSGGQMHGLVALDEHDHVIRPAILWNDGRTFKEVDYLNNVVGKDRLSELTANIAFAGFTAPKLLWMRENEPENFEKIAKIMLPKDYLTYRLTGVHACDYSDASGMLLLDVQHKRWSQEMLEICGVSERQMPQLFESFAVVGRLTKEAAQTLGLSRAQTFFSVLLPQTAKRVLLPVTNEVITLVKDTALASTIAVADLMSQAERQVSNSSSIEPYIVAMLIYLVINGVVEQLCKLAERKFNYYQ